MDKNGSILDGYNRLRACKAANVPIEIQTYEGDCLRDQLEPAPSPKASVP